MTLVGKHNIAKMTSLTTGTGTLTLLNASVGFNTFALAGVLNAEIVTYTIRDGAQSEVGIGTYTSAGTTLSRTTVLSSTNAGSKISCSGRQTVMVSLAAEDIQPFASYNAGIGNTVTNGTDNSTLTLDTELADSSSVGTLASDTVTLACKGWYWVTVGVYYSAASAFNGYIKLDFDGIVKYQGYTTAMGILEDQLWVGPFMYNVSADGGTLGPIKISNHLGFSIDIYIQDLTAFRIGNQ